MRSCPERAYILAFFAPPPPLSDENPVMLHFFAYAEIIFAHILVFPACAIEVQHINENSSTILKQCCLIHQMLFLKTMMFDPFDQIFSQR